MVAAAVIPSAAVRDRGSHRGHRRQHLFRTSADQDRLRQVYPAHDAARVDDELRRPRNFGLARTSARVEDVIAADHLRLRIGKEREAVSAILPELLARILWIDADGEQADVA